MAVVGAASRFSRYPTPSWDDGNAGHSIAQVPMERQRAEFTQQIRQLAHRGLLSLAECVPAATSAKATPTHVRLISMISMHCAKRPPGYFAPPAGVGLFQRLVA
jgi:hypothetical protein